MGPLPPPAATITTARRQGPPVGRRARGTWTATLGYMQKTLHLGAFAPRDSGRPTRARTRREVRLAGPALCPLRCNPAEELIRASTTGPARSALSPACCDFDRLALRISQHRSASSKREPRHHHSIFFGTSDRLGTMLQGRHTGMKTEYSTQRPQQPEMLSCRGSTVLVLSLIHI